VARRFYSFQMASLILWLIPSLIVGCQDDAKHISLDWIPHGKLYR
jgi:hypothetical protein